MTIMKFREIVLQKFKLEIDVKNRIDWWHQFNNREIILQKFKLEIDVKIE